MSRLRQRTALLLGVVVPLGLAMKFYSGPGRWWVNNWGASFAYELFFMGMVLLIVGSASRIGTIAVGVCLGTCALEFLQLWTPGWLDAIRRTFVGRSVLGNSFSWRDFPAYPLGCLLGWSIIRRLAESPGDT